MTRALLPLAVLLACGCSGAPEDPCRPPEPGTYRVQWLTRPADCPFLEQPGHVFLEPGTSASCAFWEERDDACSLRVLANPASCGYAITNGFVVPVAEGLTRVGPDRFSGPATAWVDDVESRDGPRGRRCAEGGMVELVRDDDLEAAPSAVQLFPREAGDSCITSCASGLVCQYPAGELHDGTGYCRAPPVVGEPCGENVHPGDPYGCADLAYCDAEHVCRAHPALGEPCDIDFETCRTEPCMSDAVLATCFDGYCAPQPSGPSLCRAFKLRGEPCALSQWDNRIECDGGLVCTCTEPDCTTGVCLEQRFEGERCDEPETVCYAGLQCVQGVCATASGG